jgi:chain length determinant protein (polysaccharide antigen chain regulator)
MMSKDTNAAPGSTERTQTEQIDLIDIIQQLWAGKLIISIFVIICVALGASYAFTAQEKWSSVAIVTLPDSGQVAVYSQAQNILYPGVAPIVSSIQSSFFDRFKGGLAALSLQLQNQKIKEYLTSAPLNRDQPDQIKISYTGDSAIEAQSKLKAYLAKVDSSIVSDIDGDLTANIHSRTQELKESIASLEKVAQEKKNDRLTMLNQALTIAQHSNIEKPMLNNSTGVTDDTLFALGTDALTAMISNYKNAPIPLGEDYYSTVQNLLAVQSLSDDKRIISTFRYIMKPNIPVSKDSPKRAIILIISSILGAFLGAAFLLTKNSLKTR